MKAWPVGRWVDAVLVLIALALVIVVGMTSGSVTTGEALARERNLLAAFREDELTRIVIERGAKKVVLEREEEDRDPALDAAAPGDDSPAHDARTWRLVEPVVEEADAFAVEELVTALDHATAVRRIREDDVDRSAMGLAPPRFVVALEMGTIHYRLVVGGKAAAPEGSAYVEISGDGAPRRGVAIVRGDTIEQLDVDADDLREAKLVPYLSDALRAMTLEGVGGKRKLRRDVERWRFDGMMHDLRVDRRLISDLFVQLVELGAKEPVPMDRATRILDAAKDRIVLTELPQDNKPRAVIAFGGRCPRDADKIVAVRREPDPRAGCAPREIGQLLATPADQLLATRVFSFHVDEVEQMKSTGPQRKLELVRRGSAFHLRQPEEADVGYEAGTQRLVTVTEARGVWVAEPDLRALGLEPARTIVELSTGGASEAEVLREQVVVGEPDADGFAAVLRRADGAVLRIDRTAWRALTPDATLVRPRALFDFDAKDVRDVAISGRVDQEIRRQEDGTLHLVRPSGVAIDAALADDLLKTLAGLEAERWVSDVDDGSFGLDDPVLRIGVDVERDKGESAHRGLAIGSATTGGSYASREGDSGVFVLSRLDERNLEQLAIDRSVFVIDPQTVTRLGLLTARADVELVRIGESFEQRAGQPQLDSDAIARLVDAMSGLRPEAALHTGPARPEEGLSDPVLVISVTRDAGRQGPIHLRFGSGDAWQGVSVHYARADGVDATYVVPRSAVSAIVDAL